MREKEIYNKYRFTVAGKNTEGVLIKDDTKTYNIDMESFNNNFQPAYALTLYCIQGESIPSYHYPSEDNYFVNGRSAYTLISRLKI